jgi:hypothetical protein
MTSRKKESALGRGLDALIRPEIDETDNKFKKSELNRPNAKNSRQNKKKTTKSTKKDITINTTTKNLEKTSFDNNLVENVILEVHKNPRISLWSAKSAAVLRLLKKTKPEFSISKEASALIEEAVKNKYPDIWEVFDEKEI